MEEGQRRAVAALAAGGAAAPRIRTRKADRTALPRRAALTCGVAIPAAVSPGKARLASRPVGRKDRPAAAALLPANRAGSKSPGFSAAGVADVCPGHQPNHWSRKWLIGTNRFANVSRT